MDPNKKENREKVGIAKAWEKHKKKKKYFTKNTKFSYEKAGKLFERTKKPLYNGTNESSQCCWMKENGRWKINYSNETSKV